MNLPFYTIGHSTRTLEEFVALLRAAEVELIVDVRTVPRSRTNPQYNRETLPGSLAPFRIDYEPLPQLGGLRGKSKTIAPDVNDFWENQSFHNFADYALSDIFHEGFEKLITLGRKRRCAIMCSEAVWWRCHRRIISDYLLIHGETVFHLMGHNKIEIAHVTESACPQPSGAVTYSSHNSLAD
ncbi:DUF488 domain-containing protein [Nitrosomonas sp.]|uniref:DUF488 domain-containing protein n=1 Tax=Nitrosomonas sp. TaxID=42353 RepID=UPI0025CC9700|nr:DUF488 domain-containing protein [Nitrosomonas sp.]MCC6916295.1 DUF488 domain-containing protein [Nitrosomonas sp.]